LPPARDGARGSNGSRARHLTLQVSENSDDAIAAAQQALWDALRVVAEPGAAPRPCAAEPTCRDPASVWASWSAARTPRPSISSARRRGR